MKRDPSEKFNYELARETLRDLYAVATQRYQSKEEIAVADEIVAAANTLFASTTQSYREALLGCGIARLIDPNINIRHPYVNQGDNAFNGRSLDEFVINPFLHDHLIPSSKGPYLATFRRSVKFTPETQHGLRDKPGYLAFLSYLDAFESAQGPAELQLLVIFLLSKFIQLQESTRIPLARIARLSLSQYARLLDGLLATPSGGLIPLLLTVAMFNTIRRCFDLNWEIIVQGINVADKAAGVGGDVTIRTGDRILLAVEVTERPIDRARVVSTFVTKIAPQGIQDYLFLYTDKEPVAEVHQVAMQYFAQGHAVDFLKVQPWLVNLLGTVSSECRAHFTNEFVQLLDTQSTPAAIKMAWNDQIARLVQ